MCLGISHNFESFRLNSCNQSKFSTNLCWILIGYKKVQSSFLLFFKQSTNSSRREIKVISFFIIWAWQVSKYFQQGLFLEIEWDLWNFIFITVRFNKLGKQILDLISEQLHSRDLNEYVACLYIFFKTFSSIQYIFIWSSLWVQKRSISKDGALSSQS